MCARADRRGACCGVSSVQQADGSAVGFAGGRATGRGQHAPGHHHGRALCHCGSAWRRVVARDMAQQHSDGGGDDGGRTGGRDHGGGRRKGGTPEALRGDSAARSNSEVTLREARRSVIDSVDSAEYQVPGWCLGARGRSPASLDGSQRKIQYRRLPGSSCEQR